MEPFITSSLSVAQKVPTKEISGLTTGVVVYSKVGPIEATKITSPKQFLDLYTVNKSISKGDHSSLQNAYFLSRFTDLVVTRATNTRIYPLVGLQGSSETSVLLPSGYHTDTFQILTPTLPANVGDVNSLWLQIDNVLFYNPQGVDPFEDGDGEVGGTATARVKGTEPDQLEAEGLGTSSDWDTVQLSVPFVQVDPNNSSNLIFNPAAYQEIADAFKGGGPVERGNLHVVAKESTLEIHYNSEYPVVSDSFNPLNRDGIDPEDPNDNAVHNTTVISSTVTLSSSSSPYFIGYKNVGSVHTLKAWITDVETAENPNYQNWILNLEDPINGHLTYKVSDDPDGTDNQGNPTYWTNISDIREDIIYIKNPSAVNVDVVNTTVSAPNVGKSEDFENSISSNTQLISSAIYATTKFADYSGSRIHLYTDAGWYNKAIAKSFESISPETKSLTCVGIDPFLKDKNVIKSYAAGFNGYYSIIHVNGGKDTSVVGFQLPISPSCYYIETIARNSTRNSNYAPTFSKTNGAISESNLYNDFSKSVRDELNKSRVNVLHYDDTDGVSYINNNLLTDSSGSLIDEDQSIRLINDVQYDIEKLMESFHSRFNIEGTRSAVTSAINNYFETIISPQNYTISGYRVECSEVNNSEINIENNELKVDVYIQLNHSIKYITVATNVVNTI
jgi:hypothetical protein